MKVYISFWLFTAVIVGTMTAELKGTPRLEQYMQHWNQTAERILSELSSYIEKTH